jgi:hypothetical protein
MPLDSVADDRVRLQSKKYSFIVEDTMPILNFELASRKGGEDNFPVKQDLTIELHSPISGEIFEAKTQRGRIEVDNDGTITCFSRGESLGFSVFLGRTLSITMVKKTGEVTIRTPSKIKKIEDHRTSNMSEENSGVFTDEVKLVLE